MARIMSPMDILKPLEKSFTPIAARIAKKGGYEWTGDPIINPKAVFRCYDVQNIGEAEHALRIMFVQHALEGLEKSGSDVLRVGDMIVACTVDPVSMCYQLGIALTFEGKPQAKKGKKDGS